jgi:alpha-beta hydrolase superfamily lysophospholipase
VLVRAPWIGAGLAGRAMSGPFERLEFQSQIDLISQDLQDGFWQKDSKLIAVSYGAYLLLHALSDKPPFLGSILLLSPVMGGGDYRACT